MVPSPQSKKRLIVHRVAVLAGPLLLMIEALRTRSVLLASMERRESATLEMVRAGLQPPLSLLYRMSRQMCPLL